MKKIIALLFILLFTFPSCEKDDICDGSTPTTPRLVIEFYNISDPLTLKNVTNLKVIGDGMDQGIIFNSTATGDAQYVTNGTKISVPLKTDTDSSTYRFILNYGNANPTITDTDEITFNYTRQDVFVSRACGFKTVFKFAPSNPIVHTAVPSTDEKWIQDIRIQKSNIDTEYETHIKIYF